jgi:hypothetical protein
LIIAFPALVSSGLTKDVTIDADKAFREMQIQPRESASQPAGAADAKDDPMKGLLESLKKDQEQKP